MIDIRESPGERTIENDGAAPLRIAFVCHEYPPCRNGGIGTFTRQLGRALAASGHEVRAIGMYHPGFPGPGVELDEGVQVYRLARAQRDFLSIRARWELYAKIRAWVEAGEVDVIEVPDYEGWAAGWPRMNVPVVTRLHGSATYFSLEMGRRPTRTLQTAEWASVRRADFVCSVSVYVGSRTQKIFRLKAAPHVAYNPVEPGELVPLAERSNNFVMYCGSLTAKKGIQFLIKAWPRVLQECPGAQLHIFGKDLPFGDATMKEYLLSSLNHGTEQTVTFHGHVSRAELLEALRNARVAVFPSLSEAFALGPMEAMSSGCPTVYSRRASGPELIRHGADGLLVEPTDLEDLAAAIVNVLKDGAVASRLGNNGYKRVSETFSYERLLPQFESFYRRCMVAHQPRGGQ